MGNSKVNVLSVFQGAIEVCLKPLQSTALKKTEERTRQGLRAHIPRMAAYFVSDFFGVENLFGVKCEN